MGDKVLIGNQQGRRRSFGVEVSADVGWQVLTIVGGVLGAAGLVDLVMLWIPARFGQPEWEFGTVAATMDTLPLVTLGTGILLAASLVRGWRWGAVAAGVGAAVAVVMLLAAMLLWLLNVPLAWQGVNVEVRPTLLKAMLKTVVLWGLYLTAYGAMGFIAWRRLRTKRSVTEQGVGP